MTATGSATAETFAAVAEDLMLRARKLADSDPAAAATLLWMAGKALRHLDAELRQAEEGVGSATWPHGSPERYLEGCRCEDCRAAARSHSKPLGGGPG